MFLTTGCNGTHNGVYWNSQQGLLELNMVYWNSQQGVMELTTGCTGITTGCNGSHNRL